MVSATAPSRGVAGSSRTPTPERGSPTLGHLDAGVRAAHICPHMPQAGAAPCRGLNHIQPCPQCRHGGLGCSKGRHQHVHQR